MNTQGQRTILLVEDEPLTGITQSAHLEQYGYDVIHVPNGQKAIESVRDPKSAIDLILMDINLGQELDGTEIASLILKEYDIPILFLSSHIEREIVDKTENISSYGYVVKKSGITVLDASIKMAFRLHQAHLNLKFQKEEIEHKKKELQFYEKRYRRLFESARDGILILNADSGMIVDVNPFLIEMLGFSKDEFLDKHIWDISAFKNIDYSKKLFKELQDKEYVRYEDLPLETRDGKLTHVEFVSNVYLVDHEKVIQCNIRDITDRKLYEKSLTNNIDQKEALLGEIQHRTKNSFNMITSLIQLRAGVTNFEETKSVLNELSLRVQSISDLYSLLYDTESIYEVQLKTYCDKVIESMLNLAENTTINKNIEETTVSTKNAATIGMILVELLSNAIKYAFPGSQEGTIDVELKKNDSQMILSVKDNGIGLKKDFDIATVRTLGLHLVRLMVAQLNGTIKFIVENGTNVIVECPL